jgi:hypothetical protein
MSLPRPATLNPARVWRAGMDPEVLLAAKLAWLLLLCSGFLARAGRPGAAVVGVLDTLPHAAGWLVPALFLTAGAALLMNQLTRPAAIIAGVCVLITPLGSLAAWRGHEWIAGAVLLLAGLEHPGGRPWLLRVQATLGLLAVLLDQTGAIDWSARPSLEGWQIERDTPSLILWLRDHLPAGALHVFATWIVPASALGIAAALWLPRLRDRAIWWACAWLLTGYVLVATDEAAFFTLAMLITMLGWLNWPRESLKAHWPRACGWPMWLRIALDHYDFDQKTEWPFPSNPDADLDVWVDGKHLVRREAIVALLLYFPLFHMGVLVVAVVLLLTLPQPWAAVAHASIGLWLLVFFALPTFRRLRRKLR